MGYYMMFQYNIFKIIWWVCLEWAVEEKVWTMEDLRELL